ncbi:MAG: PorV/PorQ family protein [Bacteroidota bacterium]
MRRHLSIVCLALALGLAGLSPNTALAQTVVKYGAEFLAGGVGARALGMGGAYVGLADDVTAGYWNPAGLDALAYPQGAYMHAERFSGIVSFDYGAVAWPVTNRSTLGVSFFRSGVDDIANTLEAFNPDTGLPLPNAENNVTYFSAVDYAFFVSYARRLSDNLRLGVTGKVIRRSIGDFANAWGYSADIAAQYQIGRFALGLNIQDVTGMLQAWTVNDTAFEDLYQDPDTGDFLGFADVFGQDAPVGLTELVLPVARLGSAYALPLTEDIGLNLGFDLDLAFDGQQTYVLNAGDLSFRPRFGTEVTYRGLVALRAGIADVTTSERYGTQLTPTLGAGLALDQINVDYGFGDFGGLQSELGSTHRISVMLTLEQPRFARADR